jgi:hypothetical protein
MDPKERGCMCVCARARVHTLDSTGLGQDPVAYSCEHDNELSGSLQDAESLDYQSVISLSRMLH